VKSDPSHASEPTSSTLDASTVKAPTNEPGKAFDSPLVPTANQADEGSLVKLISELWSAHSLRNSEVRQSRGQLRAVRLELGKELFRYKELLADTGRGGKWTPFLRDRKIPRATADRYVLAWAEAQKPAAENRLSEAISPPTGDEIAALVKKTSAKLLKSLVTPDSRQQFLDGLALAFEQSILSTT